MLRLVVVVLTTARHTFLMRLFLARLLYQSPLPSSGAASDACNDPLPSLATTRTLCDK